jgi:hypothetical protein
VADVAPGLISAVEEIWPRAEVLSEEVCEVGVTASACVAEPGSQQSP